MGIGLSIGETPAEMREHGYWSQYKGDSSRNESFNTVYHLNYCCFSIFGDIYPMKNTRYVLFVSEREVEKDDKVPEDDSSSSDESIHNGAENEITAEDDESEDINDESEDIDDQSEYTRYRKKHLYEIVYMFIEIYDLLEEKFVRRSKCVCFSILLFSSLLTILWCLVEIT